MIRRLVLAMLAAMLCAGAMTGAIGQELPVEQDIPVGRELSGYYGQDIARAAEEIGGLTLRVSDEYAANYESAAVCLRGNGGLVGDIELTGAAGDDSLCGVKAGMARAEVEALMAASPALWDYPEELAYTVREDGEDELKNELLVVFFDGDGRVSGAWYRASGIE